MRPTDERLQSHDFITLSVKTKPRIYSVCAPLYEKGMSLREISKETGIPKTSVKESLNAHGVALLNYVSGQIHPSTRATVQKPGGPPYGYGYIDGQLAIDPREYSIVKKILNLWQSGKNFNAISTHLNGKKTQSRNHSQWTRSVVRAIVLRHESKNVKSERE